MGFDAELRASIRDLQSAATALKTEVDKGNASLRQMQTEVKTVAVGHREAAVAAGEHGRAAGGVAEEIHGIGRAARFAGGEGGTLVSHLSHLVSINPLAIAAGLGIGFITEKIGEMIETSRRGQKQLEEMLKVPDQIAMQIATESHKGKLDLNTKPMRKEAFESYYGDDSMDDIPDEMRIRAVAASRDAVAAGRAENVGQGLDRLRKARAFRPRASGMGPVRQITDGQLGAIAAGADDDEKYADSLQRFKGTQAYRDAEEADYTKTVESVKKEDQARAHATIDSNNTMRLLKDSMDRNTEKLARLIDLYGSRSEATYAVQNELIDQKATYDRMMSEVSSTGK